MDYDREKEDELVLALLHLTTWKEKLGIRAWKGHDWDAMNRLHEKGYISDPRRKAKSVAMTEESAALSEKLFYRHFGRLSDK